MLLGLAAFAIYALVYVVAWALPLVGPLEVPKVREDWTDPNFYIWTIGWWPYALSHGLNPLYSTAIGAPSGYSLAWATTTPTVALVMWPVTALFGPVVSFNLVLLAVPPLSGLAAFAVARRLTGRFWASLLAGAVYGFCPLGIDHSLQGQPNLTVIGLLPVMVYLVLLKRDGVLGPVGYTAWMAVVMALEFYTFNETFMFLTMVGTAALVVGYAVAGRSLRGAVARLAGLTAIAYAGALVLVAPYLFYALQHNPKTVTRQGPKFSLDLTRLILPSSDKLYGITPLIRYSNELGRFSIENYVGIPVLVILIALAITRWRDPMIRVLVIMFGIIVALAAGPVLVVSQHELFSLPWGFLWQLPVANAAEPSRIMIFGFLAASIAVALWLRAPAASRLSRALRWALAIIAVGAILADLPSFSTVTNPRKIVLSKEHVVLPHAENALPPFITEGLYRHYLRPRETVVVITTRGNAGMEFQSAAGFYFRIVGGFINTSITRQDALPAQVGELNDPTPAHIRAFQHYARRAKIGAVLVEDNWAQPWMRVFPRMGLHGTTAGGVTVYPMR